MRVSIAYVCLQTILGQIFALFLHNYTHCQRTSSVIFQQLILQEWPLAWDHLGYLDIDKLFVSQLWWALHRLTSIKLKMSTVYHPQTDYDFASECTNKTVIQCICFTVESGTNVAGPTAYIRSSLTLWTPLTLEQVSHCFNYTSENLPNSFHQLYTFPQTWFPTPQQKKFLHKCSKSN